FPPRRSSDLASHPRRRGSQVAFFGHSNGHTCRLVRKSLRFRSSLAGCVMPLHVWPNLLIHALKAKALLSGSANGRGFGSVSHHQVIESQPLSAGIFFARSASVDGGLAI